MTCAILLAATAALAPGAAGHELEQVLVARSRQGAEGEERVTRERMTTLLAGDRARVRREDGTVTVVRLDLGEIYEVDDLLESYERKSFKELRDRWRALNALLLEQIEGTPLGHPRRAELVDELTDGPDKWREIWKLPPGEARRALLRKYRLPDAPPRIEVRRTRETKVVAGRECVRYESLEDGEVGDWAYLAPGIPFDARYYEFMRLSGWISPELADGLRGTEGAPLESVVHLRAGGEVELRTESVRERGLDASLFEIPADYREREARPSMR